MIKKQSIVLAVVLFVMLCIMWSHGCRISRLECKVDKVYRFSGGTVGDYTPGKNCE